MAGHPLDKAIQSCEQIFSNLLGPMDELGIITFSDHAVVRCGLTPVDDAGKLQLRECLCGVRARGSTNLHEGLGAAAGALQQAPSRLRRVLVVLSDGKPNRGLSSASELAGYVRSLGVATSTLGFGAHFDEDLLDAIATAGSGRFNYIVEPALARADLARAVLSQGRVVADRLELELRPSPGVEVLQLLPASRQRFGSRGVVTSVGDVFQDEARAFAVELKFHLDAGASGRLLEVSVDGRSPVTGGSHTVSAMLEVDVRVGSRRNDPDAQREVVLLQADAARIAARMHADRGTISSAASTLRVAIARIDAVQGFVPNDGSMLAELREELLDLVVRYERRTTEQERLHHRKSAMAYKTASPFFERAPRSRPAIAGRLVGVAGPVSGRTYRLWSETMIGRSPRCDIAINHPSLGRNHARIQFVDNQFLLVDLGAGVGTFVNGQAAQSSQLANGDLLRVGEVVFRFESEGPATSQQTLPWIE